MSSVTCGLDRLQMTKQITKIGVEILFGVFVKKCPFLQSYEKRLASFKRKSRIHGSGSNKFLVKVRHCIAALLAFRSRLNTGKCFFCFFVPEDALHQWGKGRYDALLKVEIIHCFPESLPTFVDTLRKLHRYYFE